MRITRVVEYGFFFGLLVLTGYMVWQVAQPFLTAIALSAIVVTICYPLYEKIKRYTPRQNATVASLITTLLVLVVIILPIIVLSSLILREMVSFYQDLERGNISYESALIQIQTYVEAVVPSIEFDVEQQLKNSLQGITARTWDIFTGTVSIIFVLLISLVGTFYLFRDGKQFLNILVKISPLPDQDDHVIFKRLARSVRSVATGTVLTALIQGTLVAVGFSIFSIERAILWGSVASVSALMPGIGTTIITAPAIVLLFVSGDVVNATGLLIWSMLIVGMIDNLIGPYLMGRGNNMHPFIVLIAVLGGVIWIGPIGFVIGPMIVTLFLVLLEIYSQYASKKESGDEVSLV
jgi:predicted PurR-regulated permease PerM